MGYLPVKFANFLKSRLIFNIQLFLNACIQIFHISHFSHIKSKYCFNEKSSTYYFHMKTEILAGFQICNSVPLNQKRIQKRIQGQSIQFKNGPSKICGSSLQKIWSSNFLKAVFHNFYLVRSWITWPTSTVRPSEAVKI